MVDNQAVVPSMPNGKGALSMVALRDSNALTVSPKNGCAKINCVLGPIAGNALEFLGGKKLT